MDTQPEPPHDQPDVQACRPESPTSDLQHGCPAPDAEESRRRWAAWHQAMELSHEMLLAGLRQRIGPAGDLNAAYRAWYERYQALKWNSDRAT